MLDVGALGWGEREGRWGKLTLLADLMLSLLTVLTCVFTSAGTHLVGE